MSGEGDRDDDAGGRELRTFGRRRGRKLSPRQDRLMAELLPRLAVDLAERAPADLRHLFGAGGCSGQGMRPLPLVGRDRVGGAPTAAVAPSAPPDLRGKGDAVEDVWLEIGFGGAEHLLWQSTLHRHVGLIGCEPFEEGVVKALAGIEAEGLDNVRLHADDARPLLRWLPDASIGRAFILFPDPWPKKRHAKRRLVQPALLAELARVMKPGAELRIGTDIGDYARTVLLAMREVPAFTWLAQGPSDWRVRPDDWPATRYEQKGLREGRRCTYLRFRRAA